MQIFLAMVPFVSVPLNPPPYAGGLTNGSSGITQTQSLCSLWFICDDRRDFEVPSQASNWLSIAQIPEPFHAHQVVYTGHYVFPFRAPKQELTLFTVKTSPLAQSSILRQHRGLGEQSHHCHHLLLSESHQDLTGLTAMPCIPIAATVRNTCFRKNVSFFSHKLSVPMVPTFLSSKSFPFKISSWNLLHSHLDILFGPKCSRIDKVTLWPNKNQNVKLTPANSFMPWGCGTPDLYSNSLTQP